MTTEPPKHSAQTVGSTFMRQYYHLLAKEPQSLHRFYKDESVWCHGVGSNIQAPVSGQQAIHDEILRRGYAGAHVDLDIGSIDCQDSLDHGVFVLVTGVMTLAADPKHAKPFVQTFFLAVQPRGYFVLNDCLRFLELPAAQPAATKDVDGVAASAPVEVQRPTSPAVVPAASTSPKAVVGKEKKEEKKKEEKDKPKVVSPKKAAPAPSPAPVAVSAPVASPVKEKVVSPKKAPTSPTPKVVSPKKAAPTSPTKAAAPVKETAPKSPVKKPVETTEKPAEKPTSPAKAVESKPEAAASAPAAAAVPAPAATATPAPAPAPAPAAPRSWAALFSAKNEAAPPAALAKVVAAVAPAAKPVEAPAAVATPAPAATPAPVSPKTKPAETTAPAPHERKPRLYTLYIRDVPAQAKESDVRELFQTHGSIASITVSGPRGFAFVDYVEEASMRAALAQEAEYKLFDKVLQVDERRDKERGGFRADSRGRGRGHGPRGRIGDRRDRDDNKERREGPNNGNGRAPTAGGNAASGPRPTGDRREKGGRRGGAKDARAE